MRGDRVGAGGDTGGRWEGVLREGADAAKTVVVWAAAVARRARAPVRPSTIAVTAPPPSSRQHPCPEVTNGADGDDDVAPTPPSLGEAGGRLVSSQAEWASAFVGAIRTTFDRLPALLAPCAPMWPAIVLIPGPHNAAHAATTAGVPTSVTMATRLARRRVLTITI